MLDSAQAHIASILANVNRDAKTRKEPYRIDEFLLLKQHEEPAGPVLLDDPDAQTEAMIAAMFGGQVERA